ncbi:hypothetical protein CU110_15235 [Cobetia sp. ICG0124]|nr:hypothetical protein CU110_15235 [Cobetia sp. ICG0124]
MQPEGVDHSGIASLRLLLFQTLPETLQLIRKFITGHARRSVAQSLEAITSADRFMGPITPFTETLTTAARQEGAHPAMPFQYLLTRQRLEGRPHHFEHDIHEDINPRHLPTRRFQLSGFQPQCLVKGIAQCGPAKYHAGQAGTGLHLFTEQGGFEAQTLASLQLLPLRHQR